MMLAEQYKTQPLVSDWIDGSGQRETDLFQLGKEGIFSRFFLLCNHSNCYQIIKSFGIFFKGVFLLCGNLGFQLKLQLGVVEI